jgi:hypothetical protein
MNIEGVVYLFEYSQEKKSTEMSLDEKISKAQRAYNDKMAHVNIYYVSDSEKRRLKNPSKGQKIKRRRRAIRLGLLNDDEED